MVKWHHLIQLALWKFLLNGVLTCLPQRILTMPHAILNTIGTYKRLVIEKKNVWLKPDV